jgi:hypothetical protein
VTVILQYPFRPVRAHLLIIISEPGEEATAALVWHANELKRNV